MTPWAEDQAAARPLFTQDNTNTEERQTFMPRMKFESTIPVFERVKLFHAIDGAATVIVSNQN
jgi:hypothetical protein